MKIKNLVRVGLLALVALTVSISPVLMQGEPVEIILPLIGFATELEGWTAAVDAANEQLAEKNIHITIQNVQVTDWSEYYQRVLAQVAGGQKVDIGRLNEAQLPVAIADELVMDLTDRVAEMDRSLFFDAAFQNAGFQEERYYGLPSGIYYMLMYYNKSLFDAAGLAYPSSDWENSITFDQVREYAKALTQGEDANKVFGFSAGPYMAFLGMYSVSGGGDNVFTEDGACALEQPETIAVYNWFDSMLREDQSQPRPTDTRVMSAFDMFSAGRVAMIVDGTWFQSAVRDITNFEVGIAAVPSASGQAYSSAFVDSWVIWEGTEHPEEAWLALQALYSAEASLALAERGVGGLPIRRDTLETLSDTMIGENFDEDSRSAFINGLDHIITVPYNEHYNEIDNEINSVMDEWLLGNITAEEFAAQSCATMAQVMGQ